MQLGVIRFYSMVTFVVGVLAVAVLAAHVTSYFIPENHHVNIKEAHVANLYVIYTRSTAFLTQQRRHVAQV